MWISLLIWNLELTTLELNYRVEETGIKVTVLSHVGQLNQSFIPHVTGLSFSFLQMLVRKKTNPMNSRVQ